LLFGKKNLIIISECLRVSGAGNTGFQVICPLAVDQTFDEKKVAVAGIR
jgi:hypothetical protein